ncbi:hypothetical protein ACAH01_02510 [Halomicrobium sp. HM KBTZ05]|uniref:Uncharacterized protein n=1 Tax=Halomicrobium mukohataei TaxID=57705 RepID=A0A847U6U1_9EURY|nr:hypothetical protein [Halomicrobium mukohataei]NLV08709.1 hypothetical protein [Halomicrobium mukohataei]
MGSDGGRSNLKTIALGLAVLFVPALIIVATLEFLILTGDLVLNELTPLQLVELYLIDLVLFAGGAYLLYRLLLYSIGGPLGGTDDEE